MPKSIAIFASFVLALAGANVIQIWSLLSSFLFTDLLPKTPLFTVAFWLWFVTAGAAAWCGLQGGYSLLRTGNVASWALTIFVVASCVMFVVNGQELGYASVRFGLHFGLLSFQVGVNVLGFALVWWLVELRREFPRWQSLLPDEATRGRGAV